MPKYELREQGHAFTTIDAESAEAALDAADEPSRSDYGDTPGTYYADWHAVNVDDSDDRASRSYAMPEPEPECPDHAEHDWQSPHEIVGGVAENPGVHGHGGGVIITECCMHCGCKRTTDTWAQRSDTGEQGLTEVSYELAFYAEQIADAEES